MLMFLKHTSPSRLAQVVTLWSKTKSKFKSRPRIQLPPARTLESLLRVGRKKSLVNSKRLS